MTPHDVDLHGVSSNALLLDAGAEVNAFNHAGWGPIHYAAQSGHVRLVERFIRAGAQVKNDSFTGVCCFVTSVDDRYGCHGSAWPVMLRAGYNQCLDSRLRERLDYFRKVFKVGFAAYEKEHLESFVKIFIPKFDGLPKEVVRVIVSFWGHAGYY